MNNQSRAGESEDALTTGLGLCRYAFDYIKAARVVDEVQGSEPGYEEVSPVPAYFLAMHGIELTLKAFLRNSGVPANALRSKDLSHDLRRCFKKAKELGLQEFFKPTADDLRALELLIELNNYQGLRYIRTGLKEFPSWAIVEPLAVRLHQAVAPLVDCESFTTVFHALPPSE